MEAARYPVAAKVAELLTLGLVLFLATYCYMFIYFILIVQLLIKFTVNLLEHLYLAALQCRVEG